MKRHLSSCAVLSIAHGLRLLSYIGILATGAASAQSPAPSQLNPEELQELLAPIALYPDALTALILPASTVPYDVVLGARYLDSQGDPNATGNMPWDDSVKALTRYPDVLRWMNENLEWTASVGEAFVDQPADVMNAIQSLRARARAAGNLVDTPQQRVVVRQNVIRIIPVERELIYVPRYDPEVVYVRRSSSVSPLITFGVGLAVGAWLNNDFDWDNSQLYRGNWNGWNGNSGNWNDGQPNVNVINNNVNVVNIDPADATVWEPSEQSRQELQKRQQNNTGNARLVSESARQARVAVRERARAEGAADNPVIVSNAQPSSASALMLPRPGRFEATERGAAKSAVSAREATSAPGSDQKNQGNGRQEPVALDSKEERVRPPAPGATDKYQPPAPANSSNNEKKNRQDPPLEPQNSPTATLPQNAPAKAPKASSLPKDEPRPAPAAQTPPREKPSKSERPINPESSPKNDRKIQNQPAPAPANREQKPAPQPKPAPPASGPAKDSAQDPAQQPTKERKNKAEQSQQRQQQDSAPSQRPKSDQPKPQQPQQKEPPQQPQEPPKKSQALKPSKDQPAEGPAAQEKPKNKKD